MHELTLLMIVSYLEARRKYCQETYLNTGDNRYHEREIELGIVRNLMDNPEKMALLTTEYNAGN